MAGHSTMFAVIDYLIAQFTSATAGFAVVYDGLPDSDTEPVIVSVGGTATATVDSAQAWATMPATAARSRDEVYLVNCFVSAFVGVDQSADQKAARGMAMAAYQAIEDVLYSDVRLGGLVLFAQIEPAVLDQTNDQDLSPGRRADLSFGVRVHARI